MPHPTLILARHSLTRARGMVMGVGLLLAGFEFLLTLAAASLQRSAAFDQLLDLVPPVLRTVAGPSALAFLSYSGIVAFGYFHPIVLAALVGLMIAIASEPTAEVETRFADLTLARPLARSGVITRSLIVLASAGAFVLVLMMAGSWIGLSCCRPDGMAAPFPLIRSLAAALGALMVCWAGIALAIAACARRRGVAGAIAGLLALATFLLDYLGRAWTPASSISRLSPFHYFEPMALVMGEPVSMGDVAVLVGAGAIGITTAYVAFARRDI